MSDQFIVCGVGKTSRKDFEQRFWAKVRKTEGCWLWTARGRVGKGYGKFSVARGFNQLAHRIAWILARGPIPEGLHVLHGCDNKLCVRPDHLFLGTNADNVADMVRKGRQSCGSRKSNAVLTNEKVLEIRRLRADTGLSYRKIGQRFGLCPQHAWQVATGRIWKHVASLT